jgi:plasmid stabilization system protein ParE
MAYRVKFLPKAKHDLQTIYRWIIQAAPLYGPEWFNGLEHSIYSLRDLPARCLVDKTVEIMHIRHGARRQPGRRALRE